MVKCYQPSEICSVLPIRVTSKQFHGTSCIGCVGAFPYCDSDQTYRPVYAEFLTWR